MSDINEKLNKCELDIQNLDMFISQCQEKRKLRIEEREELQKELYIQAIVEATNIHANFEG